MTRPRILVAEVSETTSEMLRPHFSVVSVPNAEAVLAQLDTDCYDLLLADLRVRGMTGVALLELARAHHPHLRTLLLAPPETDVPTEIPVLVMPVDPSALRMRVQEVLARAVTHARPLNRPRDLPAALRGTAAEYVAIHMQSWFDAPERRSNADLTYENILDRYQEVCRDALRRFKRSRG